ncbi:MAG: PEGA domain-containing protein [Clostridiales bacterium]|nr:PEGA domain-containing protein [Clostridiales bacterium]
MKGSFEGYLKKVIELNRNAARRKQPGRVNIEIGDKTINYRAPASGGYKDDPERTRRVDLPPANYTDRADRKRTGYNRQAVGKPAARPKAKPHFGIFLAFIIFAGVVVSVSAFALMISSFNDKARTAPPAPTRDVGAGLPLVPAAKEVKQVCLIKATDPDTRTFTLYGILDGRTFYMTASGGTVMKDKHGGSLVFAEFKQGDVVDIAYLEDDSVLISIQQSPQAQTFFNLEGVIVDAENNRITVGNKTYIYGPEFVCLYKGKEQDPAALAPEDRVTLRVYKTVAMFMDITTGHGVIDIVHNEYIKDGSVEIGNLTYAKLEESRSFSVPEGIHKVVVKGQNIEIFQRDVTVTGGETVTVDLAGVQMKYGSMYFTSNVPDVYLTVNDNPVSLDDALPLLFGLYEIKATAFGYEPFQHTVDLNAPALTVQIEMLPTPTPTPRPVLPETIKYTPITVPSGAEVYIDDRYVGLTTDPNLTDPLSVDVELGQHNVRFVKDGYADWTSIVLFANTNNLREMRMTYTLQESSSIQPLAPIPQETTTPADTGETGGY